MKKVLIITGLTASGKSGLAVEIAQKYNGEIISCDSVQVYRGLDIGSAKEDLATRNVIPHHLIDVVEPTENFNVGDFLHLCKQAVEDISARGKLPLIVGGTGMYVKALLEGYTLGSIAHEDFRKKWEDFAKSNGKEAVWQELNSMDNEMAKKVHFNNLIRVIRYMELKTFGEPKKEQSILSDYDVLAVGINVEKEKIYPIINARVDKMIKMGLENEVKGLIDKGLNLSHNSMNTIGYREFYQYLTGDINLEKCIELIKQHTRNYAKRQLTFMKTIEGLKIVDKDYARKIIDNFLKN